MLRNADGGGGVTFFLKNVTKVYWRYKGVGGGQFPGKTLRK